MNINFTSVDYLALSPLLIILGGALLLLLIESFFEKASKKVSFFVAISAIISAIIAAWYAPMSENILLTLWVRFDQISRVFTIFFLLIGLGSAFLAAAFFQRFEATRGEYYFLLLCGLFGLILIGSSADFLILFLGLETLSIALYVLCGYVKSWKVSHEAAIKYFFIGSLGAALLLYGIALIYGAIGTTSFDALLVTYNALSAPGDIALFSCGIALITLGFAFKAAIVPFHIWAPDVYDGSPNPVTAFMTVGTKIGAYAAFVRVFIEALPQFNLIWNEGIALLAIPTLIYANFVALRQTQLRRFFAYSGISHSGFMLIPLAVGTHEALPALMFYLIVYSVATLGSFAVLAFIDQKSEGVMLSDLKGLFRRSPALAITLALCLLTLAGIPPTIGFFAKFYIFKIALEAGYYTLVIIGLLTTILSAFYYMRIVAVMFSEAPSEASFQKFSLPAAVLGIVTVAALVFLSFYPAPLMSLLTPVLE